MSASESAAMSIILMIVSMAVLPEKKLNAAPVFCIGTRLRTPGTRLTYPLGTSIDTKCLAHLSSSALVGAIQR